MELREAEALGVLDDHHRRVRHVDANFDDGRGDQQVDLTGDERGHHRSFSLGFILPQQRHAELGEHFEREMFGHRRRRAQVDLFAVLDQRIDDIRLTPVFQFRTNSHFVATRTGRTVVFTGFRPSGPLANLRRRRSRAVVERQRARDRRGRHHEHVGIALLTQRRSLHDAEAMLLVDDHQSELVERRRPAAARACR